MIGAEGSIGETAYTEGAAWYPQNAIPMKLTAPDTFEYTLTAGRQLHPSWVNFKFFAQPGWGREFCHHDGWATITSTSDLFLVGTGADGYDNGNIHLPAGQSLEEGADYRLVLRVNTSAEPPSAQLQVQRLLDNGINACLKASKRTPIYNLQGQTLSQLRRGVSLFEGRKIIMKSKR